MNTKSKLIHLTCAAALLSATASASADSNRYIVKFKDSAIQGLSSSDDRSTHRREVINSLGGAHKAHLDRYNASAAVLSKQQLADLMASGEVESIEIDQKRFPLKVEPQMEDEILPYGITMIQADQVSDSNAGDITVCVVDTGFDINHEDLPVDNATGTNDPGTGDWFHDGFGHGTHVSGTIGGVSNDLGVVGVLPSGDLNYHIVKVFNDSGSWTYSSDLVTALQICFDNGATVANMSLGGSGSSATEEAAMQDLLDQGLLMIAASGNDGNTRFSYPASYDSIVSVAALDSNKDIAWFSQQNNQVELAAPGVSVWSTLPNNTYEAWDGTSMATPHVTGAAALLWSNNPDCTPTEIRNALTTSAEDLGTVGRDNAFGFGLVQIKDASDHLDANPCGEVTTELTSTATVVTLANQRRLIHVDWEGATSANVEVRLNNRVMKTTANTGSAGVLVFPFLEGRAAQVKVCESGTEICSQETFLQL